jgi:hypothetical protein
VAEFPIILLLQRSVLQQEIWARVGIADLGELKTMSSTHHLHPAIKVEVLRPTYPPFFTLDRLYHPLTVIPTLALTIPSIAIGRLSSHDRTSRGIKITINLALTFQQHRIITSSSRSHND